MVDGIRPEDAILKNELKYLDVLPSHIDLVGAEVEMVNIEHREEKMRNVLSKIKSQYEFIIIDCSPSLGLITINSLTAADSVLIPVQCEYFALEGLAKLMDTIKLVKKKVNINLEIEGIVPVMFDGRTNLSHEVVKEIKNAFEELTNMCKDPSVNSSKI
jgi:chromosome partitioning protein